MQLFYHWRVKEYFFLIRSLYLYFNEKGGEIIFYTRKNLKNIILYSIKMEI
jgi:hypothetical protein